jgi:hypothetical protein
MKTRKATVKNVTNNEFPNEYVNFGSMAVKAKKNLNLINDTLKLENKLNTKNEVTHEAVLSKADSSSKNLFFVKIWNSEECFEDNKTDRSIISKWSDFIASDSASVDKSLRNQEFNNSTSNSRTGKKINNIIYESEFKNFESNLFSNNKVKKIEIFKEVLYSNLVKVSFGYRSVSTFILMGLMAALILFLIFQTYSLGVGKLYENRIFENFLIFWESSWHIISCKIAIKSEFDNSLSQNLPISVADDLVILVC